MLLSSEEFEVLFAAAEGETLSETAQRLGCHLNTVVRRKNALLAKLGARTLAEAVALAYHRRLVVVPSRPSRA